MTYKISRESLHDEIWKLDDMMNQRMIKAYGFTMWKDFVEVRIEY